MKLDIFPYQDSEIVNTVIVQQRYVACNVSFAIVEEKEWISIIQVRALGYAIDIGIFCSCHLNETRYLSLPR